MISANNTCTTTSTSKKLVRGSKTIRIPLDRKTYNKALNDKNLLRSIIDDFIKSSPQIFPKTIVNGYYMHGYANVSKKLSIKQQRIKILETREVYTIAPCDIMPYMTGFTEDVEIPLLMRRFGVPHWALTYAFGKNPMYWYRMEVGLGRNSVVGTTVQLPENLPKNLSADEKHTSIKGEKAYVATTVGSGCILGASVSKSADEEGLTKSYSTFKTESHNIDPNYKPETVNTDGWSATILAWSNIFPTVVFIYCFLHSFIKIRDRCKKHPLFAEAARKIWLAYKATSKKSFSQRLRRLREWAAIQTDGVLLESIMSLCGKVKKFSPAYDHVKCHRTSNMVDRLMRFMDKYLFGSQYFHGSLFAAEQSIRAWAILRNFQPYACSIKNNKKEVVCASKNLNGFMYRDNWLENLIVSTSMSGFRQ